jgi:RNA polymerase sigma-70 factor (ECF subfamily)
MIDEQDLLIRVKRFDTTALALVYEYFSPPIYRYAYHMLGDPQLAEECLSDTFKRFLQMTKTGKGPQTHLKAYLYRIAHNWITDHYRSHKLEEVELSENILDQETIRKALSELTPDQQQVIVLRYIEEIENDEVAQIMNKSVGSIKALQHRALAALRQNLVADMR